MFVIHLRKHLFFYVMDLIGLLQHLNAKSLNISNKQQLEVLILTCPSFCMSVQRSRMSTPH